MPTIDGTYYTDDEVRERAQQNYDRLREDRERAGRPLHNRRESNDDIPRLPMPGAATWDPYRGIVNNAANTNAPTADPWANVNLGNASREWAEDFIRRNPGDYHRIAGAYGVNGNNPAGSPSGDGASGGGGSPSSNYANVFSDPLTKQYESLLQAQLGLYQSQQAEMQRRAQEAEARRAQTAEAVKRLEEFVNQRVDKLKGPAYTGTEQEVLRTQFLDPLERDRGAAQKRALEQISARGLTPESGISQELMRLVDQEFNQYRTQGQGAIATRQIEEQRSREQEAQKLLQYLAQLPDAVARGDLEFVNFVQSMINQPGQQGLTVGKLLADLPSERLNDALATLGVAPSGGNTSAQLLQLLAQQQQQRQFQNALNANAWGNIGLGLGG